MELRVKQIKEDLKTFRHNRLVFKRLCVLLDSTRTCKLQTTLVKYGVSERSFYRWKKQYSKSGVVGVLDHTGRGRKANYIRGWLAKRVKHMRKQYLWGAEVIQAHLKYDHHVCISRDRLHRFLKNQGFIEKKRKTRSKSKHTKIVTIHRPGEYTQTDVKHITHIKAGKRLYVYNFVDHASRWSFKRVFDSYGPFETKCFIQSVLERVPFQIEKIQSDNGIEFTNKFVSDPLSPKEHALDQLCRENHIRHLLIPVGVKEINGLVEKHHHLDFKESYRHFNTLDLKHINAQLEAHCTWRNAHRRYKALHWKTPNQYLRDWLKNQDLKNNTVSLLNLVDMKFKQAA